MAFRGHGGIAFSVTPGSPTPGSPFPVFIDVSYPTGLEAGDLLIIVCLEGIYDDELEPDWTPGPPVDTVDGQDGHHLWWKVADGTETGSLHLEASQLALSGQSGETVCSAIMFAYVNQPNASDTLSWSTGGPISATFPAQTGQYANLSILVGYAFALDPGDPSSIVDPDLTVDARVSGSQDFSGSFDDTYHIEYLAASRPVAGGGAVPQYDMDSEGPEGLSDARWWRSNNLGFPEVDEELQPYWGVLVMP